MKPLNKGKKVKVFLPQTDKHGMSPFHGKVGVVMYRTPGNSSRYFIHLKGDSNGTDTEFLRSELHVV